jgi:hypothetical protein
MQAEQAHEAKTPANRGFSLIQDCGRYNSSCGYCKEEDSSVSTGKSAHGEWRTSWCFAVLVNRSTSYRSRFLQACTPTG